MPDALEHLVEGAQGVITDQLELARLEARDALIGSLTGGGVLLAAAVFVLVGWFALSMAAYTVLVQRLTPWASLCVLAAVNAAIGAVLASYGVARMRRRGS